MNIYIANIPFKANENEVRDLFLRYGQVASVRIVLDKETQKSRGFGFVIMNNDQEANDAIHGLNGYSFLGKTLAVSEAKPKEGGDRPNNSPRRNFNVDRPAGDRPNRPFTPRKNDERIDSNRPYTPRPFNSDVSIPPIYTDNKPKREKEFKREKPEKADVFKPVKKTNNKVNKYNRFDDDGDDFDYKIGKY